MATAREREENLVKAMEETKKLYRKAIEMDNEKKERFILQYIQGITEKHPELNCIHKVCKGVLERYPDRMPKDNTLLEEAMSTLNPPYLSIFPQTSFDEDILVYKVVDVLIKEIYDSIPRHDFDRHERFIIEKLWNGVHKMLVDNPNFKGANPYYKRHYFNMVQSKKTWLKILDEDFNTYIDYFKEEVGA